MTRLIDPVAPDPNPAQEDSEKASILVGASTSLPIASCQLDLDGRILSVQGELAAWLGLPTPDALIGEPLHTIFTYPLCAEAVPPDGGYQSWLKPVNSNPFPVALHLSSGANAGPTATLLRLADPGVDAKTFRIVSELTTDFACCVLLLPTGEISAQWITSGVESLAGYTLDELIRQGGWRMLVVPEDRCAFQAMVEELRRSGRASSEYRIRTAGGSIRWIRDQARAEPEAGKPGVLRVYGAIRDITTECETSRALSRAHAELESRIAERTQELSRANASLVEEVAERRRAEERNRALVEGLRAVLLAAPQLIACADLDAFYLRAIELARERLGIERCSIYLLNAENTLATGTFGVDRYGAISDERAHQFPAHSDWNLHLQEVARDPQPWISIRDIYSDVHGPLTDPHRSGEIGTTVIQGAKTPVGVMFNDNALSGRDLDPVQQQVLAVYCTLLGPIMEWKQTEQRQARLVEGLHAVVDAADELLKCESLEDVFLRAVELAREKLGLERAAIFVQDQETSDLHGTFGTDEQGRTTNEFENIQSKEIIAEPWAEKGTENRWLISSRKRTHWIDGELQNDGWGWTAWTPIAAPGGRRYHLFNDNAITNAPPDPVQQELVAIYGTILGGVLARKAAMAETRRNGEYYRALIENGTDIIGVLESDLSSRAVSPSIARILGISPEQFIRTSWRQWCHLEDRERTERELRTCLSEPGSERRFEVRMQHAEGEWRHLEVTATNLMHDPAVAGLVLNAHDVTDRLWDQRRLEGQSKILGLIASGVTMPEVMKAVTEFIAAACEPMGASVLRVEKDGVLRYLAASGLPSRYLKSLPEIPIGPSVGSCGTAASRGEPVYVDDIATNPLWGPWKELALRDGLRACWSLPILSSREGVLGTLALYYPAPRHPTRQEQDLVEAVAHVAGIAFQRAAAAEQLLLVQAAVEQSTEAIVIMTPAAKAEDSEIVYANPAFYRLTGFSAEQALGNSPTLMYGPRTQQKELDAIRVELEKGGTFAGEVWRYRSDGTPYLTESNVSYVRDGAGTVTHVVSTHCDVTERRGMEEQLRHSQKMEAVGRLAGGMAHDFNNMLAVISGYTELLSLRLPAEAKERGALREIARATERASDLTRRLLAFSRKQDVSAPVADVGQLVLKLEDLLQRLIGEDVLLTVDARPGIGGVTLDADQLEQVLINLAVNARDAMPEGGNLRIQVERQDVSRSATRNGMAPSHYLLITVSDTGTGMDAATQARAFEPFFTTKEAGRGTGLGLPMVYGCVRQHHGFVELESAPGAGATFRIYLPLATNPQSVANGSLPTCAEGPGGSETVLLAEDEKMLRTLLTNRLRQAGYRVLPAANGEAALKAAAKHAGPLDLVLTDVVMPRMGGRELVENLLLARPDLRVLYMSGYTEGSLMSRGMTPEQVTLIRKPFPFESLLEKLREVLDSPVAPRS